MRKIIAEVFYRFHLAKHILALYLSSTKVVRVCSFYNGADYKLILAQLSHVSFLLDIFSFEGDKNDFISTYTFREATLLREQ